MKASATNLALLDMMERGKSASVRAEGERYAEQQARMLETLTAVKPAARAKGMPDPGDEERCLAHLESRVIGAGDGMLVGSACGCSFERVTVAGRDVRVVLRRGET